MKKKITLMNYFTDKHNNAMHYILKNLTDVEVIEENDLELTVLLRSDDAINTIEALAEVECFDIADIR